MNINIKRNAINDDELEAPARRGEKWTDDEETILIKSISEDKLIDDIAMEHKRTPCGIRSRLRLLAFHMIEKEGKSIEEVSTILPMTHEEIKDTYTRYKYSQKRNTQSEKKKIIENRHETELDVLKNIREILLRIEVKLQEE